MDFIVPLKQVGLITRSVLEAIHASYKPKRIIVVTKQSEGKILRRLAPFWKVGIVETVDEETFFVRNFNLTLDEIIAEYDHNRPGDKREPGWWVQQLIKLGAATQIPNISPVYVVWDGKFLIQIIFTLFPVNSTYRFAIPLIFPPQEIWFLRGGGGSAKWTVLGKFATASLSCKPSLGVRLTPTSTRIACVL
jgi:hypothetical protein